MKTTIFISVAISVLFAIACTKESNTPAVSAGISHSSRVAQHFIGEHFGGGIIFYLDSLKKHGLIAFSADFEEPSSWSFTDVVTGAKGTGLGKGFSNTSRIITVIGSPADTTEGYAAFEAASFGVNGYYDWYLPSKEELNQLYKQKEVVGGFNPYAYWSSTEADASTAWFQNFRDGSQPKQKKTAAYAIRPIRYF